MVKVDKFVFPTDFIILDMEEDHQVPIILGRTFLNIARAIVDIRESKLTLRVGEESVTFGVDQAILGGHFRRTHGRMERRQVK